MARKMLGSRRVSKSGYSLKITIPRAVVEEVGLKPGDKVKMEYDTKRKWLILKFKGDEDD